VSSQLRRRAAAWLARARRKIRSLLPGRSDCAPRLAANTRRTDFVLGQLQRLYAQDVPVTDVRVRRYKAQLASLGIEAREIAKGATVADLEMGRRMMAGSVCRLDHVLERGHPLAVGVPVARARGGGRPPARRVSRQGDGGDDPGPAGSDDEPPPDAASPAGGAA
jgi:hypothetical protein